MSQTYAGSQFVFIFLVLQNTIFCLLLQNVSLFNHLQKLKYFNYYIETNTDQKKFLKGLVEKSKFERTEK